MSLLENIPEEDRKHFITCTLCMELIDCRDLNQVIAHTHEINMEVQFTSSKKEAEPVEYLEGKLPIPQN